MSIAACKFGGHDCKTPKGRVIWSREPMDHADLAAHDAMIDELDLLPEIDEDDAYYASDAADDGYGWERHALQGAYNHG